MGDIEFGEIKVGEKVIIGEGEWGKPPTTKDIYNKAQEYAARNNVQFQINFIPTSTKNQIFELERIR